MDTLALFGNRTQPDCDEKPAQTEHDYRRHLVATGTPQITVR